MVLDAQQQVRELLTASYVSASAKNDRYSLRAFAKRLEISSAALSEILRGKRKVSHAMARKFCARLQASPKVIERIEQGFAPSGLSRLSEIANPYPERIVEPHQYDLFSDWLYFGVVSLLRTKGVRRSRRDRAWMAARLGVSVARLNRVIAKLVRWQILSLDARGDLVEAGLSFRTASEIPASLLKKRTIQIMRAAEAHVRRPEVERRDVSGFFMATTDPHRLKEAEQMIEDFGKRLCLFLNAGEKREVYELIINLFPRTVAGA